MKAVLFIIGIVLLGGFKLSAEDWQEGWRHTAEPQFGSGRSKLSRYRNFDFWHHQRKPQYSFELSDADLVFSNHRDLSNYALVVYDYNHNQALLAARFLIIKNKTKNPGKFMITLVDVKYKNDKIVPVCDKIVAEIKNENHRICAQRFMNMVKRGIAKGKEQKDKVSIDKVAEEIKAKDKQDTDGKKTDSKSSNEVKIDDFKEVITETI
ncbi:MAG: hypothetical protein WCS27_16755 [Victivallaceae bacterium]